jgi:hypothetical protein
MIKANKAPAGRRDLKGMVELGGRDIDQRFRLVAPNRALTRVQLASI